MLQWRVYGLDYKSVQTIFFFFNDIRNKTAYNMYTIVFCVQDSTYVRNMCYTRTTLLKGTFKEGVVFI